MCQIIKGNFREIWGIANLWMCNYFPYLSFTGNFTTFTKKRNKRFFVLSVYFEVYGNYSLSLSKNSIKDVFETLLPKSNLIKL